MPIGHRRACDRRVGSGSRRLAPLARPRPAVPSSTRMRALSSGCLVVIALALPVRASADVVMMPTPRTCEAGTFRASGHCVDACVPMPCTSTADCTAGTTCQVVDFCIEVQVACGWGSGTEVDDVLGVCGAATCGGASCGIRSVCRPGAAPADGGTTSPDHRTYGGCDCGCRATPRAPSPLGALVVLAGVLARVLSRRRS